MSNRAAAPAVIVALLVLSATATGADVPDEGIPRLERLSLAVDGGDPQGDSLHPVVSADGRHVVFESAAENLVERDGNGFIDIVVVDRQTRTTELVSVSTGGRPADAHSSDPDISADGRFVTFMSEASELVADDTNGTWDVFLRDRVAHTTERISVAPDGAGGDDASMRPTISADGSRIAFESRASNLTPDADPGGTQVYVHDRTTGTTTLVSSNADGEPASPLGAGDAQISADGRYVVFGSTAINLDGTVETNVNGDIFLKDLQTGGVERVSVATDGTPGNELSLCAAVSRDAGEVVFASRAGNLVPADFNGTFDYFVRDRATGRTERINVTSAGGESVGMSRSWLCPLAISDDGRYVSYETPAGDLVAGDGNDNLDVFVHDRVSGVTERVSLARSGGESAGSSHNTSISADGRFVVFQGNGDDLVDGDENGAGDIFLFDRGPELGIGGLRLDARAGALAVEGWVNADGAVVAAAEDTADAGRRRLGADLTAVAVAHRPESHALSVTWQVEALPGVRGSAIPVDGTALTRGVTAAPGVLYGLRLRSTGATHLLVGGRSAEGPLIAFGLYECATTCSRRAQLDGVVGVTGEEARVVLPLDTLGATALRVADLQAFTALGSPSLSADPATWLDRVALGAVAVDPATVALGIGAREVAHVDVEYAEVDVHDGTFEALIPERGSGPRRLWGRTCHATTCAYTSRTYETP